jgi:hypothetical protein
MPRKIITVNVYPPIPLRQFDWMAHYEGDEEYGARGYGRTEADAVRDLTAEFPDDEASTI